MLIVYVKVAKVFQIQELYVRTIFGYKTTVSGGVKWRIWDKGDQR